MTELIVERQQFVSYEIAPCVLVTDAKTGQTDYEICGVDDEVTPDVWTLYGRLPSGFARAIGDYDSPEAAEDFYFGITGKAYDWPQEKCDCEYPGQFYSGVPGVLALVLNANNKRIADPYKVERCDACNRFETDFLAFSGAATSGLLV